MSQEISVHSVVAFDLERFLGTWFEIGRLPLRYEDDDAAEVTATYSLNESGTVRVDNRCIDGGGEPTQAVGEGIPVEGHPGRLKVTFLPEAIRWLPFTKADYWVLEVDVGSTSDSLAESGVPYRHALVGSPDQKFLWLLSRTPTLDDRIVHQYHAHGHAQGFDLSEWIVTPQTGRHVTDQMLDNS